MTPGISGSDVQLRDPKGLGRVLAEVPNYHMHGSLFTHDNALQVSLPNLGVFVVATGWTANLSTGAGYVVLDAPNGTITIGDKGAGMYRIKIGSSFSSSKNNVIIHGAAFLNGNKLLQVSWERSIGTANALGYAMDEDPVILAPGDVIDYRFSSTASTTTVDINHGGWGILWLAGEEN